MKRQAQLADTEANTATAANTATTASTEANRSLVPKAGKSRQRWMIPMIALAALMGVIAFPGPASADGAEQVDGVAVPAPAAPGTCDPELIADYNYALAMTEGSGDLTGCLYGKRGDVSFTPGGQLSVRNAELFVGCLGDRCGQFELEAHVTNRWEGTPGPMGTQINGRCQHKIVAGTGTGDFVGVTGRLDFKDVITRDADGNLVSLTFDYKGHLKAS